VTVDDPGTGHDAGNAVGPDGTRRPLAGGLRRLRRSEPHSERYFFLLGLLLIDVCVIGLAGSGRWATFFYAPITAASLLLALRTSEARRTTMRIAWAAAVVAVVASAGVAITGSAHLTGYVYFMMIGLLFTFVYLGLNGVHPDFFAQGVQKDPSVYLYFSFITMTTVGFGDFTPGYSVPRVLVVFEAMLGQVFLVTAVARLVSLYSSGGSPAPEPGDTAHDAGNDD
jgi:hypothetical protein